jgi:hypothetical protein
MKQRSRDLLSHEFRARAAIELIRDELHVATGTRKVGDLFGAFIVEVACRLQSAREGVVVLELIATFNKLERWLVKAG